MFCRRLVGPASQPFWGRVREGQRLVSGSIQSTSQLLSAPCPVAKPDCRAAAYSPRTFVSGGTADQQQSGGGAEPQQPQPQQQQRTNGGPSERVFTNFAIYKGRAAMAVRLIPPAFTTSDSGYRVLDRDGVMLLEFANANAGYGPPASAPPRAGGINRTYNWGAKMTFALTPVEMGEVLAGDKIAGGGLTLYHDPAKLGRTGEPTKKLTLKQMPDGNISFNISAGPDYIQVPVSKAEFEVLKSVAHYAIPRLLGFDTAFA
ncbi:hypothetical protein PLESTB_001246700 [Pleodorina starrii]|uniref:Uncharacterized protein n=1 Tax=Pleodorina starrii TaxID=330485 RepID=A0A9W6BT64_9CHLO|nr:hypothetical protein PLESTM_000213200 [Pleodorina starrii]GLC57618.1 hypothetical protein PLESTB_001246700 [Pleodorina starrii]GLC63287.1 hypothetical protein PLESTF_000020400 [Pleodorina starrii]